MARRSPNGRHSVGSAPLAPLGPQGLERWSRQCARVDTPVIMALGEAESAMDAGEAHAAVEMHLGHTSPGTVSAAVYRLVPVELDAASSI